MNFIVGSGTTFKFKPPSFNVIYLHPDSLVPIDFETYKFNLDEANKGDTPTWSKIYDYRKTYDLPDLSPSSFFAHSQQIYKNE